MPEIENFFFFFFLECNGQYQIKAKALLHRCLCTSARIGLRSEHTCNLNSHSIRRVSLRTNDHKMVIICAGLVDWYKAKKTRRSRKIKREDDKTKGALMYKQKTHTHTHTHTQKKKKKKYTIVHVAAG